MDCVSQLEKGKVFIVESVAPLCLRFVNTAEEERGGILTHTDLVFFFSGNTLVPDFGREGPFPMYKENRLFLHLTFIRSSLRHIHTKTSLN